MKKNPTNAAPCPPNGLPRAAWWRQLADDCADPAEAERCRRIGEAVEKRELGARPLHKLMKEDCWLRDYARRLRTHALASPCVTDRDALERIADDMEAEAKRLEAG